MSEFFEVPSPFCGVGTDDLTIKVDGAKISVIENGCAVNTPAFEQPITDNKARINGKEVELKEAIAHAASLLKNTNYPVIGGCAVPAAALRGFPGGFGLDAEPFGQFPVGEGDGFHVGLSRGLSPVTVPGQG